MLSPLLPRNLNNDEAHKIRQRPVAAMRAQHIQILDVEGPTAAREEVVDLAVVVEEEHALLGDVLAGEIVRLHFNGGGHFAEGAGAGGVR